MDPKIYEKAEHTLDNTLCDANALKVISTLQENGHVAYLVGGSVRDLALKRSPKDYDISTSAKPEEIKAIFRGQCLLIGRRFRLAHIRFGKKVFEVSTFRAGDTESAEFIVHDNVWGTPEQDVKRRDFTINGLFYDPSTETVIDFVGGYPDLKKEYLRTIGQPFVRFKQDPVRMIRLIKFQARFNFEIDSDALVALAECAREILKSSQARILEELLRMLESGSAEPFIDLLDEHRFLELLMPALAHFIEKPEGEAVFDLLFEVDSGKKSFDRAVLLSCLVFPFLQHHIETHFGGRTLGPEQIYQEATSAISTIFLPFFVISRRLRTSLLSIVTAQFRMAYTRKKIRIPKNPDFPLALDFLRLRAQVEPSLLPVWKEWNRAYGG